MKKIILLLLVASHGLLAQNYVEQNPDGQLSIIQSRGLGSLSATIGTSSFNARYSILATGGNTSNPDATTAIVGFATNSIALNIGVAGSASSVAATNYGIYGNAESFLTRTNNIFGGVFVAKHGGVGESFGTKTLVEGSGSGIRYGSYTEVAGAANNIKYGNYIKVIGNTSDASYGIYSLSYNDGVGINRGAYFSVDGVGTGDKYGINVMVNGSGTSDYSYGGDIFVNNNTAIESVGWRAWNRNTGAGLGTGAYFGADGTGAGNKIGVKGIADGAGNYHYGMYSEAAGSSVQGYGLYTHAHTSGTNTGIFALAEGANLCFGSNNIAYGTATNYGVSSWVYNGTVNIAGYFRVNSGGNNYQLFLKEDDNDFARIRFENNLGAGWDIGGTKGANATNSLFNFYYVPGASDVLSLKGDGNATLAGTLVQLSDKRLKQGFSILKNSIQSIAKLWGYHYHWKGAEKSPSLQTGLVAQEVQKVFPELVETNDKGLLSVNYIGLIPHLIESVKELKAQNEKLQAELKFIKKKIKK